MTNVPYNDTDPENDSLQAQLVTSPINTSSFALQSSGTFTYVHNGSETTTDSLLMSIRWGQARKYSYRNHSNHTCK